MVGKLTALAVFVVALVMSRTEPYFGVFLGGVSGALFVAEFMREKMLSHLRDLRQHHMVLLQQVKDTVEEGMEKKNG